MQELSRDADKKERARQSLLLNNNEPIRGLGGFNQTFESEKSK